VSDQTTDEWADAQMSRDDIREERDRLRSLVAQAADRIVSMVPAFARRALPPQIQAGSGIGVPADAVTDFLADLSRLAADLREGRPDPSDKDAVIEEERDRLREQVTERTEEIVGLVRERGRIEEERDRLRELLARAVAAWPTVNQPSPILYPHSDGTFWLETVEGDRWRGASGPYASREGAVLAAIEAAEEERRWRRERAVTEPEGGRS
jgi:hypothetical protein